MSYYPKPESHINNKIKIVLNSTNYATKKESEGVAGVYTSNLAAIRDFVAMKAEVDKLDIKNLLMFQMVLIVQKQK